MKAEGLTGCCVASLLHSFGEAPTAAGYYGGENKTNTVESVKKFIIAKGFERPNAAFLQIVSNDQQKILNKALLELGFEHSTWMSKRQHAETKVRIWWKHIPTLIKERNNAAKEGTKT